jgi:hypothetical protein
MVLDIGSGKFKEFRDDYKENIRIARKIKKAPPRVGWRRVF